MDKKYFKYIRIIILICLLATMIGLYFVQVEQFKDASGITKMLDSLHPEFPRVLNWVSLVLISAGWITWEFAYSKSGNKLLGYISAGLIFISLFFTFNLLSFIAGFLAITIIIACSLMFLPNISEKKLAQSLLDNKLENEKNNAKIKKLIKNK